MQGMLTQSQNESEIDHRARDMWLWIVGAVVVVALFIGGFLRLNAIHNAKTPMPAPIDNSTNGVVVNGAGGSGSNQEGFDVYGAGIVTRRSNPGPIATPSPGM